MRRTHLRVRIILGLVQKWPSCEPQIILAALVVVATVIGLDVVIKGLGAEVMLRVGSATAGAAVNPALVDTTTGENLNHGGALVQNHLYMATMTDHYITAGGSTVKVLVRGSYTLS